jgi:hypothetical protein
VFCGTIAVHIPPCCEWAVELRRCTAFNRDAVEFIDAEGFFLSGIDDATAVRADRILHNAAIFGERVVELRGRAAFERHAVKVIGTEGVLLGAIDDIAAVRADRVQPDDVAIFAQWVIELCRRAPFDGHTVEFADRIRVILPSSYGLIHHVAAIGADRV